MDTLYYLSSLRLIHIVTGVFWAGATCYLAWFVLPAVKASKADGDRFMQKLSGTNKLPVVMSLVSLLNIVSGIMIIGKLSNFEWYWFTNRHGILVSIGSLFAMIAFVEGFLITRPNAMRFDRLARSLNASGKPPTEEQIKELTAYKARITVVIRHSAFLLAIATIAMSLIHYL